MKSLIGEISSKSSRMPSCKNHAYEAFCTSIRFGRSIASRTGTNCLRSAFLERVTGIEGRGNYRENAKNPYPRQWEGLLLTRLVVYSGHDSGRTGCGSRLVVWEHHQTR